MMAEAARLLTREVRMPLQRSAATRAPDPAHSQRALPRAPLGNAARQALTRGQIQARLAVGPATDRFEQEAEHIAHVVTAPGAGSTAAPAVTVTPLLQRAATHHGKLLDDETKPLQRRGGGLGEVPAAVASSSAEDRAGGEPLPAATRAFFDSRFGYDFSDVRVHTDSHAALAAAALDAEAFTVGQHVFFGAGRYQPESLTGRHLIAHELTHTIQQDGDRGRVAARVQRAVRPISSAPRQVQRSWLGDKLAGLLGGVRELAKKVPGYELLTVVLNHDPITDAPVERSPEVVTHAVLTLFPVVGEQIYKQLEERKQLQSVYTWFTEQVSRLDLTWETIKQIFHDAAESLGLRDLISPAAAWQKILTYFGPPLRRVRTFAEAVFGKIVGWVKDLALAKLREWGTQQRGYELFTFVLGRDPFTDVPVERTARGLVHAVLKLVPGGDKIFDDLDKSHAIERTVAWLNAEIARLDLTWATIKGLFRKAWDLLQVSELLHPLELIAKLADIFLPPIGRVLNFAIAVGKKVLEFIFEGALRLAGPIGEQIARIFRKIGSTFDKIVSDPIGFVGNLVQALKLGLQQFVKRIGEHLKAGLIGWLVGALEGAGIVLPKVWDLRGIVDLVLQILGISYAKIRAKLVPIIGEKTIVMLERTFAFVKALLIDGPAAAWKMIVDAIGSFWDLVIGGIKDWAITKIVTAAVTKLLSMLNPVGAVIQAIIAIYNTVAFFIERIRQILAMVEAIVDSIANIANGKLTQAADYVEQAMARTIPVVLGFLARLIGLGDVSGAIKKVVAAIQEKVDKAIDAVIKWIVDKVKSLFGGKDKPEQAAGVADDVPIETPEPHTLSVRQGDGDAVIVIHSAEQEFGAFLDHAEADPQISKTRKEKYLASAREALATLKDKLKAEKAAKDTEQAGARAERLTAERALAKEIEGLLGGANLKTLRLKYELEGKVGTYGTLPKISGDQLTPDHQPQAALIELVASLPLFKDAGVQSVAGGSHADGGQAINLHFNRHVKTRTYGKSVLGDVETSISTAAAGPAKSDAIRERKKESVIGVVKSELQKDVDEVRTNINGGPKEPSWQDLYAAVRGKGKSADDDAVERDVNTLREEIIERIERGENQMERQSFAHWL